MSGLLLKKGPGALKASKIRFFRLEGDRIEYFPVEGGKCLGTIDLAQSTSVGVVGATRLLVQSRTGRMFDLEAQTEALRDAWVSAIVGVASSLGSGSGSGSGAAGRSEGARSPSAASVSSIDVGSRRDSGAVSSPAAARRGSVAAASPVTLEGTVKKRGGSWRSLKARHFVLQGNRLEYLLSQDGKKQGEVLLGPTSAVGAIGAKGFRVQSYAGARVFECEMDSTAERDKWVAAISSTIDRLKAAIEGACMCGC
jgi:hypothetical protein